MTYWARCEDFLQRNKLPQPSTAARMHSEALYQTIEEALQTHPMPFSSLMQHLLYDPAYGYYTTGCTKLGAAGDFITAPELSPLFAESLAKQCLQVFEQCEKPCIVEFGPGSGRLAMDLFRALLQQDSVPERYYLVEVSAELKARQQQAIAQALPEYQSHFVWLDSLQGLQCEGVVIANEVLDAMPVEVFCIQNEQILRQCVQSANNQWQWHYQAADELLQQGIQALLQRLGQSLPDGYQSEFNPWVLPWLRSISDCLTRGAVLLIDYGFSNHEFFHPQRSMGTLMCHYRHYSHIDPCVLLGLQDVTAHVNFTQVALAADDVELDVSGFATQAHFLLSCGILQILADKDADASAQMAYNQQLKKLTLPHEMGDLFKVMALTRGLSTALLGFELQDWRYKL